MTIKPVYWYWPSLMSLEDIKKINKKIINNYHQLEDKNLHAVDENGIDKKNTKTYIIKHKYIENYINPLLNMCLRINKSHFGYDADLDNNPDVNFNIYESNIKGSYDWHVDESQDPYLDIKLTILINMSEKEYEGGDLLLQHSNEMNAKEFKTPGSMLMFRSFVRHKVTPVTKGTRKTLTYFLVGPHFK